MVEARSLSNRVLRNAVLVEDPSDLGVLDRPRRPSHLVGDTFSDAYERGKRDGLAEGRRAGDEAVAALGDRIEAAIGGALEELRLLQHVRTEFLVSEAIAIAEFIAGREVAAGADVLVPRIEAALAAIDDAPLTIQVSSHDLETVRQATEGHSDISIAEDPSLASGEARINGPWAEADITMSAAIEAARQALS